MASGERKESAGSNPEQHEKKEAPFDFEWCVSCLTRSKASRTGKEAQARARVRIQHDEAARKQRVLDLERRKRLVEQGAKRLADREVALQARRAEAEAHGLSAATVSELLPGPRVSKIVSESKVAQVPPSPRTEAMADLLAKEAAARA